MDYGRDEKNMEQLKNAFLQSINEQLLLVIISSPRKKNGVTKIKIRPLLMKGNICYQEESFMNNQAFHKNITEEELISNIDDYAKDFKQIEIKSAKNDYICLVSKKLKVNVKVKKNMTTDESVNMDSFSHNRTKKYVLPQNKPVDFLVELGVMTAEGKVKDKKYDKFRQINRFLEFVEDIADKLPDDREITILDFGCGKSYLTFAIYYYLHEMKKMDVRIIGLDLKKDVIEKCNRLKEKLNYEKLTFLNGDIADYNELSKVDMVVTLHACDTATDYALAKAVAWNAKVILSVPCCQHELNKQIKCETLQPVLKYGLLKERMSALFTDGLRASLLEQQGYNVQILEFIDMEHTPKNILIRAVKNSKKNNKDNEKMTKSYMNCRNFINGELTLEKLISGGMK